MSIKQMRPKKSRHLLVSERRYTTDSVLVPHTILNLEDMLRIKPQSTFNSLNYHFPSVSIHCTFAVKVFCIFLLCASESDI